MKTNMSDDTELLDASIEDVGIALTQEERIADLTQENERLWKAVEDSWNESWCACCTYHQVSIGQPDEQEVRQDCWLDSENKAALKERGNE